MDKAAGENKGLAVVILMSDDKKGATEALNKLAKEAGVKNVALTVNDTGTKAPDWLKLNSAVKHTVTYYKGKTVEKSAALNEGTEAQCKEIVAAAAKLFKAAG